MYGAGESSSVWRTPPVATFRSVISTGQSSQKAENAASDIPSQHQRSLGRGLAEALVVSVLQRSDRPSPSQVRGAVAAAICAYGDRGCAELVAQEFGDHPETAVERMRWARGGRRGVHPTAAPACAGQCPETPGLPVDGLRTLELVMT